MHQIVESGVNMFDFFDEETRELGDVCAEVVEPLVGDEVMGGDLLVIDRIAITNVAHRGHKLGLFMIEAADKAINGHMSTCVLNPFPLQFAGTTVDEDIVGFSLPLRDDANQSTFRCGACRSNGQAPLVLRQTWVLCLQRHKVARFMMRWNGYGSPALSEAMT
jgi:hypothetical protein